MEEGADAFGGGFEQAVGEGLGGGLVVGGKARAVLDPQGAIGAEQRGAQHEVGPFRAGEHGNRAVAGAAKAQQKRAFGADRGMGGGIVDRGEQGADVGAPGQALDTDGPLRGGGQPVFGFEHMAHAGFAKAGKACGGEQGYVGFIRLKLGQPRGDIAAKRDDRDIGPGMEHLRGAARRARPHARTLRNRGDAGRADQHVAHIGARQHGGNGDFLGADGLDILHRVDGKVDLAMEQRGVEFLGPQRLAADFGERAVLDAVAAGHLRAQFDRALAPAHRGAQARAGFFGLGHGERRAAGAQTERAIRLGAIRLRNRMLAGGLSGRVRRGVHAWVAVTGIISKGKLRMALILGIESSCDETAVAVIDGDATTLDTRIVAQRIASQDEAHRPYGGVVPEIAARAHADVIAPMVAATLADAGLGLADMDAIAATAGPGLIGGVMVGLVTGKALAMAANKPLIGVNHLEGHALSPRLADPSLAYPYCLLLVSGGHCQILEVQGLGRYRRLATTIDDALGEAFDKTAKVLGLGYPGGPAVERLAREGNPRVVRLPRPLVGSGEPHFSFAGLKSAVVRARDSGLHTPADLAASFQQAAIDCVIDRTRGALATCAPGMTALVVAGGVAANASLRGALEALAGEAGLRLVAPPVKLCTDNAAMIGWAGAERFAAGFTDPLDLPARPRWPLDDQAAPVRGAGVKA